MPPKHHHHHHKHDPRLSTFLDRARIERALEGFVPDKDDRDFVVRCLLEEGPAHHRGSNWVLLALLAELVGAGATVDQDAETIAVPLRVPPHLSDDRSDDAFPLPLPRRPLEMLAPGDARAQRAMAECLTDGPPQHSLANAAMLCLLDAALRRKTT